MTRGSRRCRSGQIWAAACWSLPSPAWAHAFGERYDLPVPLGYFVVGAAVAVALSFVVAALFMRGDSGKLRREGSVVALGPVLPALRIAFQIVSVTLLCTVVVAGLFGTLNPEMNLAPVLVWIIWWVGLSFVVACIGNVWRALDPWRALFEGMDAAARRVGLANGVTLGFTYPASLGAWPAVFLLLLFVWIEVLYPHAVMPSRLAAMTLAWSAVTLLGMVCFGGAAWRRNADVFSLYFSALGRFAAIGAGPDARSLVLRAPGSGLIASPVESLAMVAFVIAMLATVLFDGLLGTQALLLFRHAAIGWLPQLADDRGYFLGTASLIAVWLSFLGAYLLSSFATAQLVRDRPAGAIARLFALTLVPIAIAYTVAHYFSYLVVHGQLIIPLISDPLGRGWDLFGTIQFYPDIGIISARVTWHLAIVSIVVGHVISIWLAHRLALREFHAPRQAVLASVPLTVLMVIFTVISLLVMAEPLVQFGTPGTPS
ncbi:MAG: hypothetical protein OEP48_04580 [Betaproteobacteria bacterium]|nr:hypothetical protein [Betaproteobacteria bacterium]MDH3435830.1 hypothetical protein [Betaproteobacteria bacterium]